LEGLAPGADLQIRAVETAKADTDAGPIAEYKGSEGKTFALYGLPIDSVSERSTPRPCPCRACWWACWWADPVVRWCGRGLILAFFAALSMLVALAAIRAGQYVLA
jgi:hypothetical protein